MSYQVQCPYCGVFGALSTRRTVYIDTGQPINYRLAAICITLGSAALIGGLIDLVSSLRGDVRIAPHDYLELAAVILAGLFFAGAPIFGLTTSLNRPRKPCNNYTCYSCGK